MVPPPLPVKLREADYSNLPDGEVRSSFLYSGRVSLRRATRPLPAEPAEENIPPIPPPKPPKHQPANNNNNNTNNNQQSDD